MPKVDETIPIRYDEFVEFRHEMKSFRDDFIAYKLEQASNRDLPELKEKIARIEESLDFYKWLSRLAIGGVIGAIIGLLAKP